MLPLDQLNQRPLVTVPHTAPVPEAARLMAEERVGCLLILDERSALTGIVTDSDIARAVARSGNLEGLPISEVMTPYPVTAEPEDDLEIVLSLMMEAGIRRIPVVRREQPNLKRCVGLITLDGLIAAKIIDFDRAARIVQAQIRRRAGIAGPGGVERKASQGRPASSRPAGRDLKRPTLNRFYREIEEATGLPRQSLVTVVDQVLTSLVRSLSYAGAAHFITYLPVPLHERLFELDQAGPEHPMTPDPILDSLDRSYGIPRAEGREKLIRLLSVVAMHLPDPELSVLRTQLPSAWAELLSAAPAEIPGERAAA